MRFLPDSDKRIYEKARKRLGKVQPSVVHTWADSALWAIQEGLEGDRRSPDRAALDQARTGTLSMLAAIDTLLDNRS